MMHDVMEVPATLREAGVTAREAEVLDDLGARLTNVEIAERRFISVRTVESHVSALLRKLGEPDRRRLAARARDLLAPVTIPLPTLIAAGRDGAAPFVGRAGELGRLRRLAELAGGAGLRRGVLVSGEAGIGKSRLAAEIASRLYADGAVVVHGRCQDEALVPYQPFLEAVRPLPEASRALQGNESRRSEDPATARYRLFEEFDRVLSARPSLVVLVLDDVQWLDPSSLQFLRHLLHRVDRSPLFLIATGRPEATDPRHPLTAAVANAHAAGMFDYIALSGLLLEDAASLAQAATINDAERVRVAWERTGGNPFLLTELLRGDAPTKGLPASARDAIVRRVAGLGPAVFDLLGAAAVVGEAFHLDLVAAALGGGAEAAGVSLERAFGAGLVLEDPARPGEFRFVHAIVREALLAVASPTRRTRLHLRVAEALERSGTSASPEAARHRHAALPDGDPVLAFRSSSNAYDQAMGQLGYEVAASFAGMALDAVEAGGGDECERAGAILRRGRALTMAGELQRGSADCRTAFELAGRHHLPTVRAEAVLGWAESSAVWGRNPDLLSALEQVLADGVEDLDLRARLKAKLGQVLYYADTRERRYRLIHEAVADARRSDRPETVAAVLTNAHATLAEPERLDERTGIARRIVHLASTSGHPEIEVQGLGWLAVDLLEAGDLPAADDAFGRHAALARRLGQRMMLRDVDLWAGMRATLDGRFAEARVHVERARDLGEAASDPGVEATYWVQRFWLALEGGSSEEMDGVVEPCERLASQNTDVPAWQASVALLHARRGDQAAALAHYEPLAAGCDAGSIPDDVVWLNAMTYLAETCAELGDADRAPTLLRLLEPYADRLALIDRALACKGSVHRFLGLLAGAADDPARARRHFGRALDRHEAMGAGPLDQRTRRDLAHLDD